MQEIENILKTAVETAKLALIELDRDLIDTYSPRLDFVNLQISKEKFVEIKRSFEDVAALIYENEEFCIYSLNKTLEVTGDQLLPKISFTFSKVKQTQPEYVSFVVQSITPLYTYLGKHKLNPGSINSFEDGNKQFFVVINSNKISFTKSEVAQDKEVQSLRKKLAVELDSKLRLLADFQNYKKRSEQTLRESGDMANKLVLNHIIDVIDDIKRAQSNDESEPLKIIEDKLKSILREQGLEEISAKPGDNFDPEYMEALSTISSGEKQHPNTIIHVDQIGYKHSNTGKVYKPARVIVSK